MIERHYVLQYHLYAAALQRHLKRRRPDGGGDYDHQQHFGGVGYVFLRGLQPDAATGLFFDRPSDPLLTAINRRLDGPEDGGPQTAG
jgi:exodeoxyribonuclease V beta subunit